MEVQKLIEDHISLADLIALEYANIPGCSIDDARSEAYLALLRAAETFDPNRGEFGALASRAIRNKLNTLYAKQLRLFKLFPKSLDDPVAWGRSAPGSGSESDCRDPSDPKSDVIRAVRRAETQTVIGAVLALLSPRERLVIDALRCGRTYPEMSADMKISKQAAHNAACRALQKLRSGLERMGYRSLASDGEVGSEEPRKSRARG